MGLPVFRHYKNRQFYVLLADDVLHTETKEKMVVYQALYGDNLLFVRPREMFFGEIQIDSESLLTVRRFQPIDDLEMAFIIPSQTKKDTKLDQQ